MKELSFIIYFGLWMDSRQKVKAYNAHISSISRPPIHVNAETNGMTYPLYTNILKTHEMLCFQVFFKSVLMIKKNIKNFQSNLNLL